MTNDTTHQWRLVRMGSNRPLYRRPLGDSELGFYWDSTFSGTATTISEIEVDVDPDLEHELFSEPNVQRTWTRMKQRYPLLGASIEELADSDTVEFVVDEEALRMYRPGEICISQVEGVEGYAEIRETILSGPAPISSKFLARVWITGQKDIPCRYHMIFCLIHCISDGVAGTTATREFLQELSVLSTDEWIDGPPLAERLSMLMPIEDLNPIPAMTGAHKRWREITAKVIRNLRETKKTGGHTIPSRQMQGLGNAARSHKLTSNLPENISRRIIDSCRSLGITFGSALPVLSQLAISRVLHRRRRQTDTKGEPLISVDEWEYRRIQPMHFGGPVNFRPFLDREWFNRGGEREICLGLTFSDSILPFMPAPKEPYKGDDAPPFPELLTPARFLYRARLVQSQTKRQLQSPLLFELHNAEISHRLSLSKAVALALRERAAGKSNKVPSTYNLGSYVFTNGGSSMGKREAILPYEYPMYGKNTPPRLRIVKSGVHLRCRPSELYLGALTDRKQLEFFCLFDSNAYDEDLVREWMEDIRGAVVYYLGGGANQKSRL